MRGAQGKPVSRRGLFVSICVSILGSSQAAHADEDTQEAVSTSASNKYVAPATSSLGFSAGGAGRVHPYIRIDTHYITNPGRVDVNPTSDLMSSAHVGIELMRPSDVFEISLAADGEYDKYWGIVTDATTQLSTFAGHADLSMLANKVGQLMLRLGDHFTRSADAANQTVTYRLQHMYNEADIGLDWRPGGGALTLALAYGFFFDIYDTSDAGITPGSLNNYRHLPSVRLAWKFLPKTSLFAEAQAQLTTFDQVTLAKSTATNVNTDIISATLGATGNISNKVTMLVKGGYGTVLMENGGGAAEQTWTGQVEFNYAAGATTSFAAGALRTLQPTSLFKDFSLNGAYARWQQRYSARTMSIIDVAFNYLAYDSSVISPNTTRTDYDLLANVTLSHNFTDWLALAILNRFDYRISNYTTAISNAGYLYNDVFLRLEFRY